MEAQQQQQNGARLPVAADVSSKCDQGRDASPSAVQPSLQSAIVQLISMCRCNWVTALLVACGLICVALVITTIVLVFTSLAADNSNLSWVDHTVSVRGTVTQLAISVLNTELAIRAYIINQGSQKSFESFYSNQLNYIHNNFTSFVQSTQDNPVQSVEHAALFSALALNGGSSLLSLWADTVNACNSGQCVTAAQQQSQLATSSQSFDNAVNLLLIDPGVCDGTVASCSMRGEETYLLGIRQATAANQFQVSLKVSSALLVAVVVLLLAIAFAMFSLQRRTFEVQTEEMKKQVVEARQEVETKSGFLATMSHELRTPMNGVLAMAELLSLTELTAYQADLLSTVRASANGMMLLVNDLLMYLKIEAKMFRLTPTKFLLQPLLDDLSRLFKVRVQNKGLTFTVSSDDEIPTALVCDVDRLRQVLINLCDNALKFCEKGSINVHVQLRQVGAQIESTGSEERKGMSRSSQRTLHSPEDDSRAPPLNMQQTGEHAVVDLLNAYGSASTTSSTLNSGAATGKNSEADRSCTDTGVIPVLAKPQRKHALRHGAKQAMAQPNVAAGEQLAVIQFTVSDTGIGISSEAQRKIWQPFQQADDTVANKYGGTGLGLSIASDLVQLMGGRMSVTSQLGVGSSFNFTIKCPVDFGSAQQFEHADAFGAGTVGLTHSEVPAQTDEVLSMRFSDVPELSETRLNSEPTAPNETIYSSVGLPGLLHETKPADEVGSFNVVVGEHFQQHQQPHKHDQETGGSFRANGTRPRLRILLAEDNVVNQKVAINMLKRMNHDVVVAKDGRECVEMWQNAVGSSQRYDCILMDVQMPIMDGNDAAKEIRRREALIGSSQPSSNTSRAQSEHIQRQDANHGRESSIYNNMSSELKRSMAPFGTGVEHVRSSSDPETNQFSRKERTPIVCLSASVMDEDKSRAIASGMDTFMSKPLSLHSLQVALNRVLR